MEFGTGMVIDESIMAVDRQSHYWHWDGGMAPLEHRCCLLAQSFGWDYSSEAGQREMMRKSKVVSLIARSTRFGEGSRRNQCNEHSWGAIHE